MVNVTDRDSGSKWSEPAGSDEADACLDRFLAVLQPLLRTHSARSAWIVGSRARGNAAPESERLRLEERPFLSHAMESARPVYVG